MKQENTTPLLLDAPISFISYAKEDTSRVVKYFKKLKEDKFLPWMDEHHIPPGAEWDSLIRKTIRRCRFFLVFLSPNAINKRGYIQSEIKEALDAAERVPEGKIFVIPIRLEECQVPDRLAKWQYVDVFKRGGYGRLKGLLISELGTEYNPPIKQTSGPDIPVPHFKDPVDGIIFKKFLQVGFYSYGDFTKTHPCISDGRILQVRDSIPKEFSILERSCRSSKKLSMKVLRAALPDRSTYRQPGYIVNSIIPETGSYHLYNPTLEKPCLVARDYFHIILAACENPKIYVYNRQSPIVVEGGNKVRFLLMPLTPPDFEPRKGQ